MGAPALLLPILLPLALLPWVLVQSGSGRRLAPWAPLPALVLAVAAADSRLELPGVLLGTTLGLDASGRLFLLFTALVWLLAGAFARGWMRDDPRQHRFWAFFLAAEAGNLGLCLAQDAASFYLLFALMSFAAYGLVVHSGTREARRAGRVYLVMAVLGEALLVAGMLLAVAAAGSHQLAVLDASPLSAPAAALLIAGFGIKVGVPLLHMWLPLAHPVAPVPASAVLSGVMLKAGLLGWLRFLPLGAHALPEMGAALMLAGLAAIFLGVAAGLAQREPKVLLAYSSVSQMGYLSLGVGAGLAAPAAWPLLLPALGLYALHHALAKSALFLGVGQIRVRGARPARLAALALPALALAGAPLSSGMLAKTELKHALAGLAAPWPELIAALLPLAAVGTAVLMARLLWLAWRKYPAPATGTPAPGGNELAWLLLVAASAALPWTLAPAAGWPLHGGALLDALWPLLVAALLVYAPLRRGWRAPALPPGDVLLPLERGLAWLTRRLTLAPRKPSALRVPHLLPGPARQLEARLLARGAARVAWLALLAGLAALLARG